MRARLTGVRVGMVTNYYVPEVGMNTYYLSRGLGRLGMDVTLFCADRYGVKRPSTRFEKGEIEEPFTVKHVKTVFNVANVPIMRGLSGMLKDSRTQGFDLFQTEDAYQLYSWTTARASRSLGIPLLLRHDLATPPQSQPYKAVYRLLVEGVIAPAVVNRACRAVVPTKAARAYLGRIRPELPISIVPFGVDAAEFHPGETDGKTFEILTVARLIRQKGIVELLKAFAIFNKSVQNSRLTLIGRGSFKTSAVDIARSLGILDAIRFVEQVRHDGMPEYFRACDMFVLPSYEEAMPISVMEAMASGKPVIATNIPGIIDIIDNGLDGVLVTVGDVIGLSEAMESVYHDVKAGVDTLGKKARAKIVEKYDWAVISRRMVDEYATILAQREPRLPA